MFVHHAIAFLVYVHFLLNTCDGLAATINIGLTLPFSSEKLNKSVAIPSKDGFFRASKWIHNNPVKVTISSQQYELDFNFVMLDDGNNDVVAVERYKEMINNRTISILLGPHGSATAKAVGSFLETQKIPSFFWSANEFGTRRRGISVIPSPTNQLSVTLYELRRKGASTITLLFSEEGKSMCASQEFNDTLIESGFPVAQTQFLSIDSIQGYGVDNDTPIGEYPESLEVILEDAAREVMNIDSDAFIFCSGGVPRLGNVIMKHFKENDYTPKAFISDMSIDDSTIDPALLEFRSGVSVFEEGILQYPDNTTGEVWRYLKNLEKEVDTITEHHFNSFVITEMMKRAIENVAGNNDIRLDLILDADGRLILNGNGTCDCDQLVGFDAFQEELFRAVFTMKFDTFFGKYFWDAGQVQQRSMVFLQYINREKKPIAPERIKKQEFVYPMPTWSERVFEPTFGHWTELAITTIAIVFIVKSLCLLVLLGIIQFTSVFSMKVRKAFMAASPLFICFTLLGSIILYSSVFVTLPNVYFNGVCYIRIWIIDLGFVTLFGPLFAKTFRVERLWRNKTTTVFRISNLTVLAWVASLLGIHIILLTLLTLVGGSRVEMEVVDSHRPKYNFYICKSNLAFEVLTGIIAGADILLVLLGCVLAFRVRLIPIKSYNEANLIFFSVYNIFFFALISIVLTFTNLERYTTFALVSVINLFATAVIVVALFGHKYALLTADKQKSKRSSKSRTKSSVPLSPHEVQMSNEKPLVTGSTDTLDATVED